MKKIINILFILLILPACGSLTPRPDTPPTPSPEPPVVVHAERPFDSAQDRPEMSARTESAGFSGDPIDDWAGIDFAPVYFDFDRSYLKPNFRERLQRLAVRLRNSPRPLILSGHADQRGSGDYNVALSERRARAVAQYLSDLGVAAGELTVVAHGEERPVCREQVESCWRRNRRVEFERQ